MGNSKSEITSKSNIYHIRRIIFYAFTNSAGCESGKIDSSGLEEVLSVVQERTRIPQILTDESRDKLFSAIDRIYQGRPEINIITVYGILIPEVVRMMLSEGCKSRAPLAVDAHGYALRKPVLGDVPGKEIPKYPDVEGIDADLHASCENHECARGQAEPDLVKMTNLNLDEPAKNDFIHLGAATGSSRLACYGSGVRYITSALSVVIDDITNFTSERNHEVSKSPFADSTQKQQLHESHNVGTTDIKSLEGGDLFNFEPHAKAQRHEFWYFLQNLLERIKKIYSAQLLVNDTIRDLSVPHVDTTIPTPHVATSANPPSCLYPIANDYLHDGNNRHATASPRIEDPEDGHSEEGATGPKIRAPEDEHSEWGSSGRVTSRAPISMALCTLVLLPFAFLSLNTSDTPLYQHHRTNNLAYNSHFNWPYPPFKPI